MNNNSAGQSKKPYQPGGSCIFVEQPYDCSRACCSGVNKLFCLINKKHLVVTEEGEHELVHVLLENIHSPERFKIGSSGPRPKYILPDVSHLKIGDKVRDINSKNIIGVIKDIHGEWPKSFNQFCVEVEVDNNNIRNYTPESLEVCQ